MCMTKSENMQYIYVYMYNKLPPSKSSLRRHMDKKDMTGMFIRSLLVIVNIGNGKWGNGKIN